jgi:hypothetical protein
LHRRRHPRRRWRRRCSADTANKRTNWRRQPPTGACPYGRKLPPGFLQGVSHLGNILVQSLPFGRKLHPFRLPFGLAFRQPTSLDVDAAPEWGQRSVGGERHEVERPGEMLAPLEVFNATTLEGQE